MRLGDPEQQVPSKPKLIGDVEGFTGVRTASRTHLEFPLSEHHLGVDPIDLETCVQAGLVMRFGDVSSGSFVGTYPAVVRALGLGKVPVYDGPPKRTTVLEKRVLLLKTKPGLCFTCPRLEHLHQPSPMVGRVGCPVLEANVAQGDGAAPPDGVGNDFDRVQEPVGVSAVSLPC